jgi:hypothetical protein
MTSIAMCNVVLKVSSLNFVCTIWWTVPRYIVGQSEARMLRVVVKADANMSVASIVEIQRLSVPDVPDMQVTCKIVTCSCFHGMSRLWHNDITLSIERQPQYAILRGTVHRHEPYAANATTGTT